MGLTYGFDLGTNSIGWAVIDEGAKSIEGMGSVVFPMGVNLEKGSKEVSKNETRRVKRQIRRQTRRSKIRKHILARALYEKGMFLDIPKLYARYFPEGKHEKFGNQFKALVQSVPPPAEVQEFFAQNPYTLRARAYEGDKLSLLELGRVFYQFALRRGYRETLQEEKGKIYEGKPKEGKTGINETAEQIEKYGTLGNYLHNEDPHSTRLRDRYTLRSMYTSEFDTIWANQKEYHPRVLTDDLYKNIGFSHSTDPTQSGILFFQRPLRSQKHLLGNCQFETDKPVSPKSTPDFERYRAWSFANNIRLDGEPLSESDQKKAVEFMLSNYSNKKFKDLKKKLSYHSGNFNFGNDDNLPANKTLGNLKAIYKSKFDDLNDKTLEDLWHLKYWAHDPDWLRAHLAENYGLSEKQIDKFSKFSIDKGYSNLSRKALRNILPFLKKGYPYDEAVLLAGVARAFGNRWRSMPVSGQSEIEDHIIGIAKDGTSGPAIERISTYLLEEHKLTDKELQKLYHHSFSDGGEVFRHLPEPENVRNPVVQQAMYVLRSLYNNMVDEYGRPEKVRVELARDLKSSKNDRDKMRQQNRDRLDENIELKKILDAYGQRHSRDNLHKLKLFQEIKDKAGKVVNPFNPNQTFGIEDLFGTGQVQIEHIVPYSKCLNDSLGNKTLCDADTNRAKGERTPFEYFTGIGADWQGIKDRIFDVLPYHKAKRFIKKEVSEADEFISRQLNDTRYISRLASAYLQKGCKDVDIIQGTVTSMLRHYWGLDGILVPPIELDQPNGEYRVAINEENEITDFRPWNAQTVKKDEEELAKKGVVYGGNVIHNRFYPRKQRLDHRHHAIDALVTALSKRRHLQQLSTAHGEGVDKRELKKSKKHIVDRPWDQFWTQTKRTVDDMLVYHKQNNRVLTNVKKRLYDFDGNPRKINGKFLYGEGMAARGSLHKESVYGKHKNKEGEEFFHIRKPIDFITSSKHVEKIADKGVRKAVEERLQELGINTKNPKGYKISALPKEVKKEVFFKADEEGKPVPMVYLPNKKGSPIPVKKVRIRERLGNTENLKDGINQYVNPRNNHHVAICEDEEGNYFGEVVTFWEATERLKQQQSLYFAKGSSQLLFTLEENDMFLLGLSDDQLRLIPQLPQKVLSDHLYRVQKVSSSYYVFRAHEATSLDFENQMWRIQSMSALKESNPVKVDVDMLGNLNEW